MSIAIQLELTTQVLVHKMPIIVKGYSKEVKLKERSSLSSIMLSIKNRKVNQQNRNKILTQPQKDKRK